MIPISKPIILGKITPLFSFAPYCMDGRTKIGF
jgi:hypothetical protein